MLCDCNELRDSCLVMYGTVDDLKDILCGCFELSDIFLVKHGRVDDLV